MTNQSFARMLFLTLLTATACAAAAPRYGRAAEIADAADVKLQTLDYDGLQKLIVAQRGKVVVMDCWATSCGPCVKEFPQLVELHKQRSADGLACISLSLDFDGSSKIEDVRPAVLKFLQRKGATFDNVISSLDSDALCKKLEFAAPPAVFVFDRQGKLRKKFENINESKTGPFSYKQIGELVDQLLKEKP